MRALLLALLLASLPLAGCAADEDTTVDGDVDDGNGEDGGSSTCDAFEPEAPDNTYALMTTNRGCFVIQLYGDKTPQTVKNFGELAKDGYFDGIKIHRVVGPRTSPPDGFMIQGGDPNTKRPESGTNGWGTGGPGYRIIDEFYCADGTVSTEHPGSYQTPARQCQGHGGFGVTHDGAGVLSMANKGSAKTGGSQFFVTLTATAFLDGYHPVFGKVVEGLDVVKEIGDVDTTCTRDNAQEPACNARPLQAVVIEGVTIVGDLPDVEVQKFSGN